MLQSGLSASGFATGLNVFIPRCFDDLHFWRKPVAPYARALS